MIDLPYHTHNSYVIGIILDGTVDICLKSRHYVMQKGMVFIVPSNVGIPMTHKTAFSYRAFCFSGSAAEFFNARKPEQSVLSDLALPMDTLYQKYLHTKDIHALIAGFTKLLNFTMSESIRISSSTHILVEQAIALMQNHTEDKCSVESIAEELYVSKYYLSHIFKNEMDISPKQYMTQNKLRRVKERLNEETYTTRLAQDMEYAAQSHLCSVFKKYMGVSIGDYRKHLTVE